MADAYLQSLVKEKFSKFILSSISLIFNLFNVFNINSYTYNLIHNQQQ